MRIIYIDSNFICHAESSIEYMPIETDALDSFSDIALEYIRYIPEGWSWTKPDGSKVYGLFIQIIDGKAVDSIQKQYQKDEEKYDNSLSEIESALGIINTGDNEDDN